MNRMKGISTIAVLLISISGIAQVLQTPNKDVTELFKQTEEKSQESVSKDLEVFKAELSKLEQMIEKRPEFKQDFQDILLDLQEATKKLENLKDDMDTKGRGGPPAV